MLLTSKDPTSKMMSEGLKLDIAVITRRFRVTSLVTMLFSKKRSGVRGCVTSESWEPKGPWPAPSAMTHQWENKMVSECISG